MIIKYLFLSFFFFCVLSTPARPHIFAMAQKIPVGANFLPKQLAHRAIEVCHTKISILYVIKSKDDITYLYYLCLLQSILVSPLSSTWSPGSLAVCWGPFFCERNMLRLMCSMSGALGSRLSQLETWSELSRSFGKLKFSCSDELYRGASSGCGHQFSVSLALIQSVLEWCSVGAWFLVVRVYLVGQILCISDCHMYRVGTLPLKSLYSILSTWYHEFRVSFLYLRLPLPPPAPPPWEINLHRGLRPLRKVGLPYVSGRHLAPKSLYSVYTAQGAQCNTIHVRCNLSFQLLLVNIFALLFNAMRHNALLAYSRKG